MRLLDELSSFQRPVPAVFPELGRPWPPTWLLGSVALGLAMLVVGLAVVLIGPNAAQRGSRRSWGVFLAAVGLAMVSGSWFRYAQSMAHDQPSQHQPDSAPTHVGDEQDWPTDRGGLARTGSIRQVEGPDDRQIVWRHQREGEAFFGSPAVVGDRLYAVGSTGDEGRIYEFDAATGHVNWAIRPPGYRATFSSPVVANERLYCGEGLHHARGARLVCLDLEPARAGQIRWLFATQGHVESTPTVHDGVIYFGAGDDGWYAVREAAKGGAAEVVARGGAKQHSDVEGGFAVDGRRAIAGLGIGGQALVVVDAQDGRELGRIRFEFPVFGSPSVADGKAYVGMGHGDYVTPDRQSAGQMVCVDLARIAIDWTLPLPGSVLGAVAIADDELICACSEGSVLVAGRDGVERVRYATGAALAASPAVTSQRVYVVNFDGQLLALARPALEKVWSVRLGGPGRYTGSPIVTRHGVVVPTIESGLVCVGRREPAR